MSEQAEQSRLSERRRQWLNRPKYVTCSGETLFESLRAQMRRNGSGSVAYLPGTTFTDGGRLLEVVYGRQGTKGGWVAARHDDMSEDAWYCLFCWPGRRHPQLRFVKPAPSLGDNRKDVTQ